MPSRVFISTECTQCGGILNLEEGTNSITCPYCRSSFLVTGYDKVVSYYIPKNVGERRTVALSLVYRYLHSLPESYRIQDLHLFYLPFYRIRGKLFHLNTESVSGDCMDDASGYRPCEVKTRYLERSFLASQLEGLAMYSLGVRTSVLRLNLFERKKLEGEGKIYPVTLNVDKAMEIGLGVYAREEPDQCVISKILSIVYAPFWEVNVGGRTAHFSIVIDGLGEEIVQERAPYQFLTTNCKKDGCEILPTITFQALACPNCGWDLVARPEYSVFICTTCHRAWESGPQGFQEAQGSIAQVDSGDQLSRVHYLPFWVLSARGGYFSSGSKSPGEGKFFIPAFKVRDLTVIYKLATAFTLKQPELTLVPLSGDIPGVQMEGAVMRQGDACELARFVYSTLADTSSREELWKKPPSWEILSKQLVWFPFYEKGIFLRDALFNIGIQKGKIEV